MFYVYVTKYAIQVFVKLYKLIIMQLTELSLINKIQNTFSVMFFPNLETSKQAKNNKRQQLDLESGL